MEEITPPERKGEWTCQCMLIAPDGLGSMVENHCTGTTVSADIPFCRLCDDRHPGLLGITVTTKPLRGTIT